MAHDPDSNVSTKYGLSSIGVLGWAGLTRSSGLATTDLIYRFEMTMRSAAGSKDSLQWSVRPAFAAVLALMVTPRSFLY